MIPTAATTISISRVPLSATRDEWDEDPAPAAAVVATGIRAVIWSPSGSETQTGATREMRQANLTADPCDLLHTDAVIDEVTGDMWAVLWVQQRSGPLPHTRAGLGRTAGVRT